MLWKELQLVTNQSIKEIEVDKITAYEREKYGKPQKKYYLVLRKKDSTYDIRVDKGSYERFSAEEVRIFFKAIQAYQLAYGENAW